MAKTLGPPPLEPKDLRPPDFLEGLSCETSEDLADAGGWLGQDRAIEALKMATGIAHEDFNVFVLGPPGTGRKRIAQKILQEAAQRKAPPSDWVYVNNFDAPDKPVAMELPVGTAIPLRKAMEGLVDELANDIPALFDSDDYQARRAAIEQEFSEFHEGAMGAVFEKARDRNVTILRTPMGFTVVGLKDGDLITPEIFDALDETEKRKLEEAIEATQEELSAVLKAIPAKQKEHRRLVEELNFDMATEGVEEAIGKLRKTFRKVPTLLEYLERVRADLIENAELFLEHASEDRVGAFPVATTKHFSKPHFARYLVNVIVSPESREEREGAPVVEEDLPTLANLIGRIEYESYMGALTTNFTMIKSGALHRANGGFLILDARQVLSEPFAWDALKQSLKSGRILIYSPAERLSMISTVTLAPEPIPLKLRVVLIGERMHYYLLAALDPDFATLFKIEADLDDDLLIEEGSLLQYARMVATLARQRETLPLGRDALSRLFEEAARLSGDREKLTLKVDQISDILREANFWARQENQDILRAADIERAVFDRETRASRVKKLSQQSILQDTVLIDTEGQRVGQINALSVLQVGGYSFGRPTRLTARTRVGTGTVVDIEREADLGGPLHSKGMLILQGYLASTYATDAPMSLWASLVFEQSYGGVDGDSASAAELLALLSSLADRPIDQSLAITGSVNQFGDIQAIGGVNEKIEGFFDICAARGLTGQQGVLIPQSNLRHLCLRRRVVDAVAAGTFRILPMERIEDGIEALMGLPAGARSTRRSYPKGSLNNLVEKRLRGFAETRRAFGKVTEKGGRK